MKKSSIAKPAKFANKMLKLAVSKGTIAKPTLSSAYHPIKHGIRKKIDYVKKAAGGIVGPGVSPGGVARKIMSQAAALNYNGRASMKTRR